MLDAVVRVNMGEVKSDQAGVPGRVVDSRMVREAWDLVSDGYQRYWSPRFRPYLVRAVAAFEPAPAGPLAVPGCGPGEEVLLLAAKHTDRSILAMDISPRMVLTLQASLRQRSLGNVLASVGLADEVSSRLRQAAGVLSAFGLQLLPDPAAALADWSAALRVGGSAAALFWPKPVPRTPFARLANAIEAATGEDRPEWEARTLKTIGAIGLALERNELVSVEMEHSSPEELFDALVRFGPLQVLERRLGSSAVEKARSLWLKDHGLTERGGRWVHAPGARLWVLRKTRAVDEGH
ncbi:MAG TPA: class I SAM-dependent methyltransferase [Planctomycetota bacterium]|nr:class I SAM-dependent methyltransferase [Planctomycetota bacterium]